MMSLLDEFFVEDETTVSLKRSDLTRKIETTDLDARVSI